MRREIRLAAHYVKRYWFFYLAGIVSLTAVDLLVVQMPLITGEIVDGLDKQLLAAEGIRRLLFRMLWMGAAIAVGRFGWRFFFFGSSRSIERDVRNDLFGHLETLSMRYYNEHKTGDLMAHFTSDLGAVRQLLGMTIITTFDASVELILVLYRMIRYVDARLTVVAVIPLIIIIFGDVAFGKAMHRRFLAKQEAFASLTDQSQEAISGIRVIKAFVQERKELMAFAKAARNCRDKNLAVSRLVSNVFPALDLIIGVSSLLTLLYGGWLAINGEITVGQFVAFNSYIGMLVWPMIAVGEAVSNISQGLASLKRIGVILDEKPDIVDEGDPAVKELRGGITLEGLSFSYPGAEDHPALRNVSVTVAPGETLAILGRTGSGKTTLVNLLERLWDTEDPDMIRLDGRPIREIPLEVLRRDIAYVPQDHFLFSDTVARNIGFGVENAEQAEIEQAAREACVHDNILEFPEGYETVLGERGVTISGGQKQRTAIARALMKRAPILILDDSLSAVDTDTEEQILRNLRQIRAGMTTLIIAHRISTIQHADHILVLEDGQKAEYGTHAELLAKQGIYRDIYEKQQLERQLQEEGGDAL
ncbi:MAG: ABC transporter ATP-binding protein [Clostridia bacterium]|nr:ABC transporter ATP-binding protein [Clostridia bacterium]